MGNVKSSKEWDPQIISKVKYYNEWVRERYNSEKQEIIIVDDVDGEKCIAAIMSKLVDWIIFRCENNNVHYFNLIVSYHVYLSSHELYLLTQECYKQIEKDAPKKTILFYHSRLLTFYEEWLKVLDSEDFIEDPQLMKDFQQLFTMKEKLNREKSSNLRLLLLKKCHPRRSSDLVNSKTFCRQSLSDISESHQSNIIRHTSITNNINDGININDMQHNSTINQEKKPFQRLSLEIYKPVLSENIVNEYTPLELAKELFLMEMEYFQQIRPRNLTERIEFHVKFADKISHWVTSEIISDSSSTGRKKRLYFFLELAETLYLKNNFNAVSAITFGVNYPALTRLHSLWEDLPIQHLMIYEKLRDFIGINGNMRNYREHLKRITGPVIPYFAIIAKNLSVINECHPKYFNNSNNLVNYSRISHIGNIYRDIIKWQSDIPGYLRNNPSNTEIRNYLMNIKHLTTDDIWTASYGIHPKTTPSSKESTPRNNSIGSERAMTTPSRHLSFGSKLMGTLKLTKRRNHKPSAVDAVSSSP